MLIALALFAQVTLSGIQAYTQPIINSDQLALVTPDGAFPLELGFGCDDIGPNMNVEFFPGSGDVAGLSVPGDSLVCSVALDDPISSGHCFTNDDGNCDIAAVPDE